MVENSTKIRILLILCCEVVEVVEEGLFEEVDLFEVEVILIGEKISQFGTGATIRLGY